MQARRIQTTIQTDGDITSQELTDLLLNNENFLNFSIVDFEISRLGKSRYTLMFFLIAILLGKDMAMVLDNNNPP